MKSRHKKKQTAQKQRSTAPKRRWTLGHLVAAFFVGAILGFAIGYESGSVGSRDSGGARTDSFGRLPGDPHYSHNHP